MARMVPRPVPPASGVRNGPLTTVAPVTPAEHKDYSATPLPRKLGIREGSRVLVVGPPDGFSLGSLPTGVELARTARGRLDVALLFVVKLADLRRRFPSLVRALEPDGRLWVAWPKKASALATDLTFATVQGTGLDAGLVDNKSASIDEAYQGIQFVYRLEDRPGLRG